MDKNLIASYQKIFDSKVKILKNQNGSVEYWTARELQELLGYKQWRNFAEVIFKAITAFNQVNGSDHISDFFEIPASINCFIIGFNSCAYFERNIYAFAIA